MTAVQETTAEQVNGRRHAHEVDWRACWAQEDRRANTCPVDPRQNTCHVTLASRLNTTQRSRLNTTQRPHPHARSPPIVVEWVQRLQTASKATNLEKSMPLFCLRLRMRGSEYVRAAVRVRSVCVSSLTCARVGLCSQGLSSLSARVGRVLARRALRLDARRQRRLEEGQRRLVEEAAWKEAELNVQGVELRLARALTEAQAARQERHMQRGSQHMRYGEERGGRAATQANALPSHSSSPATAAAAGRGSDPGHMHVSASHGSASRLEGTNCELDKRERVMHWVVACWKRSQDLVPQETRSQGLVPQGACRQAGGAGGGPLSDRSVRSIKSGAEAMERVPNGERDWNEYVIDALLCKLYVIVALLCKLYVIHALACGEQEVCLVQAVSPRRTRLSACR